MVDWKIKKVLTIERKLGIHVHYYDSPFLEDGVPLVDGGTFRSDSAWDVLCETMTVTELIHFRKKLVRIFGRMVVEGNDKAYELIPKITLAHDFWLDTSGGLHVGNRSHSMKRVGWIFYHIKHYFDLRYTRCEYKETETALFKLAIAIWEYAGHIDNTAAKIALKYISVNVSSMLNEVKGNNQELLRKAMLRDKKVLREAISWLRSQHLERTLGYQMFCIAFVREGGDVLV